MAAAERQFRQMTPAPPVLRSEDNEPNEILPFPNLTPATPTRPSFPGSYSSLSSLSWRALLPSFQTNDPSIRSRHALKDHDLSTTAWVDGLRGVAALLVLVFHFTYRLVNTNLAYGADALPESFVLWRLPIIRLFSSGSAMVALFFLISGYALSYRPIQLVRAATNPPAAGHTASTTARIAFLAHISSAIIRRPIRLFLPVVLSSALVFLLVRLGIYELTRPTSANTAIFPITPQEIHVDRKPHTPAQLYHWYLELSDLTHNAFGDNFFGGNFEYDQHMWTIPVELRSSMILFLALVPTSLMRAFRVRIAYWAALIAWSVDGGRHEMILFYAGALIAEWDLQRADAPGAQPLPRARSAPETPLLLMLALLALSYPEERAAKTPLYRYLAPVTPSWFSQPFRFWQVLGGSVLFATVAQSGSLKRPLESAVAQYLGRISYGVYLMHGPVIHTVGFGLLGWMASEKDGVSAEGYVVVLSVTMAVALWAGDVWYRLVDLRCVGWARRVSERLLVK